MEAVVGIHDAAPGVELQHAERECFRQAVKELLARPECLLSCHFLGDVGHLGEHAAVVGIFEQIVVGDLDPHPRVIRTSVPEPHPARRARGGEQLHPVVHPEHLIVRVDEVE